LIRAASSRKGAGWLKELVQDPNATTGSIANRAGCSVRKVNMTISLPFLSPDLVISANRIDRVHQGRQAARARGHHRHAFASAAGESHPDCRYRHLDCRAPSKVRAEMRLLGEASLRRFRKVVQR